MPIDLEAHLSPSLPRTSMVDNDIRTLCPSINMELEDNHMRILRQRSEGWECYNLCDMVIDLGSSTYQAKNC